MLTPVRAPPPAEPDWAVLTVLFRWSRSTHPPRAIPARPYPAAPTHASHRGFTPHSMGAYRQLPTQWPVGAYGPPLSGQWTTVGASGPHSVASGGLRPPTQWTVDNSGQHGFY